MSDITKSCQVIHLAAFSFFVLNSLLFLLIILYINICSADCGDFFRQYEVFPSDKNCVDKCLHLDSDMGLACNSLCGQYCAKKCENDPYWKRKVKDGHPLTWDIRSEKSKSWTKEEKEKLEAILSRLPDEFKSFPLDGIYRMEKSVQMVNPGTTINDSIALYDSAFSDPPFSLENVIVHELAHVLHANLGRKAFNEYKKALGWDDKSSRSRTGSFINAKAKDNAEEDFANNIESFLLQNQLLKNKVPRAHEWIAKKFSEKFKMKDKCKK